ncbi:penicillin acylase family protein, partial [Allocoleopsis sp.]|uniref:penicillin acylase family protein n=1 Tax=Allocoleopsis sp. TaxID=3088169 RepID=UPI002FD1F6A1
MTFASRRSNRFRQRLLWIFPFLLCLALALFVSICNPAAGLDRTEILWDTWGVPHIYGKSDRELFQAFGWAQMQS